MSNLAPLFSMLETAKADELRLTPGQAPCVVTDGQRRDVMASPMNARQITAAASDLLSQEELADLPSQRPRTVRHEHADVLYVIEISRGSSGIGLVIRPAKKPHRIEMTHDFGAKSKRSRQMRAPSVHQIQALRGASPTPAPPPAAAKPPAPAPAAQAARAPEPRRPSPAPDPTRPTVNLPKSSSIAEPAREDRESAATPDPTPPTTKLAKQVTMAERDEPAADRLREAGPARIDELLREMLAAKASDLHLSSGNHPVMRVHGEIHFAKDRAVLSSSDVSDLVQAIMTDKAKSDFATTRDADFAYEIPGLARFRVNVFEDRNGVGSVMRQIPIEIITVEKLGLPKACIDLCWLSKGLVVVTGPTGSGKSTTLAAMIDYITMSCPEYELHEQA